MRKRAAVLSTLALTSALWLGACSNNGNDDADRSASPSGSADSGASAGGAQTFPLPEQVTLKAVTQRPALAPSDFNEMEMAKKLETATNVHIDWETIVDTDYQEKKNLLITSGSLPDFFLNSGFSDSELIKYGKDGTIVPFNDYIDEYMPNLKALFEKRPDIKALVTAPDGNIYSLPVGEELGSGQEEIGANPDFLYINQDWLTKLNLQMPTTLEEYHDVLKAFKTQDPNGNKKADEIPLTFMNAYWTGDIGYLFGAFGVPDKTYQPGSNAYAEHLNVDGGKVSYAAEQDGYKQALAYFHQWVEEGLIDKESLTQDVTQYFAKGKNDPEIMGSFLWWDHTDVVADRDAHYPIVPPFKDMVVKWNNGSALGRGGAVITKDNKHPELTAQWLDNLYEPHTAAEVRWGPVGVWFDQDASGKYVQKTDIDNPGEYRQKVALGGAGVITGDDFKTVVAPEERAQQRMDDIANIYVPQMQTEKYSNIFFTDEELATIDSIKPELQTYTNSMRAKFLLNGVTDGDWDDYVSKLKKMGLDELMKVYQDGYDRYVAAQQ
ncbi:extracellular solute-binding protein [Cohnella fermenti]|uniref:Extracellular solute-binding protein n=1 Tax=Cohnella fermenti TaxID=2565925 RepID=A0A4S4BMZ2_9BACL|nr:extracellular solute-binding protein [Cohnella fermenti]THF75639.1 extracellular solute-binding protein [Cohnella fermenti]